LRGGNTCSTSGKKAPKRGVLKAAAMITAKQPAEVA